MKLKTAISYRLLYQLKSGSIFFGLMLVFAVLFPFIGSMGASTHAQINSDALASPCIFLIILTFIGITSDFKLFIQNGMSRNHIFLASIISNFLLAILMTCAVLFLKMAVNLFATQLKMTLLLLDLYTQHSVIETFILFFIFLLTASSLGTLIGICRNSLSKMT